MTVASTRSFESVRGTFGAPVLAAAYEGQRHDRLVRLLGAHPQQRPEVTLHHQVYEDAYFTVGAGLDGIVFTGDGAPVAQTCNFRGAPLPDLDALRREAIDLDGEVFVGFDCAWRNYYHWICLFLARAQMARSISPRPRIVLPRYDERAEAGWPLGFSRQTYRQSLYLAELEDGVLPLASGVYRTRRLHTLLLDDPEPAFVTLMRSFEAAFDPIRRRLRRDETLPRRIYVRRPANSRIPAELIEPLERRLAQNGFAEVSPEKLDFVQQAELFANAQAVVAAHGAALTNLLFGQPALSILEVNGRIGDEQHLRPWFYLLAMGRGQRYSYLDATQEEPVAPAQLDQAFERLIARFPVGAAD